MAPSAIDVSRARLRGPKSGYSTRAQHGIGIRPHFRVNRHPTARPRSARPRTSRRGPFRRWPHCRSHTAIREQGTEGTPELAEAAAAAVCTGKVEPRGQSCLIGRGQVARAGMHPPVQLTLGIPRDCRVGMRDGIATDARDTAKRFDAGEQPRLVLAIRHDEPARNWPGRHARHAASLGASSLGQSSSASNRIKTAPQPGLSNATRTAACRESFWTSCVRRRRCGLAISTPLACASETRRRRSTGTAASSPWPSTIGCTIIAAPRRARPRRSHRRTGGRAPAHSRRAWLAFPRHEVRTQPTRRVRLDGNLEIVQGAWRSSGADGGGRIGSGATDWCRSLRGSVTNAMNSSPMWAHREQRVPGAWPMVLRRIGRRRWHVGCSGVCQRGCDRLVAAAASQDCEWGLASLRIERARQARPLAVPSHRRARARSPVAVDASSGISLPSVGSPVHLLRVSRRWSCRDHPCRRSRRGRPGRRRG